MTDDIVAAVKEKAVQREDGRLVLSCAEAFALADRLGVSIGRIGAACDEKGVKIAKCQLGCF